MKRNLHDELNLMAGSERILAVRGEAQGGIMHDAVNWPFGSDRSVPWSTAVPYLLAIDVSYGQAPLMVTAWTDTLVIYHHEDSEYSPELKTIQRNP